MTWECEHVAWAAVAGAIVLAAAVLCLRTKRSWRWRITAVVLPLLAALCAALALAGVAISGESKSATPVVILLDLSASARTAPWRDPQWLRTLAESRLGPNHPLTVLGFAAQVGVLLDHVTPGDRENWPAEWPTTPGPYAQSDLESALAWRTDAERAAAKTSTGAILIPRWIITDGLLAPGPLDRGQELPFPAAVSIVPPTALDFAIHDLIVRPGPQPGEMVVQAQVRLAGPLPAAASATLPSVGTTISFQCDGQTLSTQAVSFTAIGGQSSIDATRWVELHHTLPPDQRERSHLYRVSLPQPHADPWPENDAATFLWHPPAEKRLLLISNESPTSLGFLQPALLESPTAFSPTAGQLAGEAWQTIVLDNIPAGARDGTATALPLLSLTAARALDHFVRDTGGGLLILGTNHAFAPGLYGESLPAAETLDALSPVWSRPHLGFHRHIIFVLDTSASMNEAVAQTGQSRFRILAQAVEQSAALLADNDHLTVIGFNSTATTLIDGSATTARRTLHDRLARITPSGGTVVDSAVIPLAAALQSDKPGAAETLVMLVTDGEIQSLDAVRWKTVLAATADRPTAPRLAIVAPPFTNAAPLALEALGASAEKVEWSKTADPRRWPLVLENLVAQQVDGPLHAEAISWHTQPITGLSALAGNAQQWTEVFTKPEAALWAQGVFKDASKPLAAMAQRGMGQVAAVNFSENSPAFQALLKALVAKITPPAGDRRFTFNAQRDEQGHWVISADGRNPPPNEAFLDHEKIMVRLFTPDSQDAKALPLDQTAPGHYEVHTKLSGPIAAIFFHPSAAPPGRPSPAASPPIGQLQTAAVESTEWPASIARPLQLSDLPGAEDLSAGTSGAWSPPLRQSFSLTPSFWLIAVAAALAALLSRRYQAI